MYWRETLFHFLRTCLLVFDHGIIYYFSALNLIYLLLLMVSFVAIWRYRLKSRVEHFSTLLSSPGVLPISILVPAHNEERVIVDSVRSFLSLRYRQFEVVVINDGTSDRTLAVLLEAFQLQPVQHPVQSVLPTQTVRAVYRSTLHNNLLIVDKENGGKSDALNAGINYSRYPLFCSVDADSVLEPDALLRVIKPFLDDEKTVAVGGIVRIANGNEIRSGSLESIHLPNRLLPLFQIVEYLRSFFAGRIGWSGLRCLLVISGAFGLFRKDIAVRCGGYRTDTVGEDMDLVVRMHRLLREERTAYYITFLPDPICWTEAPESFKILRQQRDRWQRGLAQSLLRNKFMLMNPRYGRIGLIAMPYNILFELLGPVIELTGYTAVAITYALGLLAPSYLALLFIAAVLFGVFHSVGSVILEEMTFHRYPKVGDVMALMGAAFIENFGYRQLSVVWRVMGFIRYFGKHGTAWGRMTRKGFAATTA